MSTLFDRAAAYFADLQDRITQALSDLDGDTFREDAWDYAQGEHAQGGGRSRVLLEGKFFEKAGCNFSNVAGQFPEDFAKTMPGGVREFRATGTSLVLHPWNPRVPTVHANFRSIVQGDRQWFGGGADLTPYFPYLEDCIAFHRVWKEVCDRHPAVASYDRFKKWCDEYFFLPHRGETRGVGGIFFDYLEGDGEAVFQFVRDAGDAFLDAYLPIAQRRGAEESSPAERDWQLYRRGRYVEFNLVYDRGTLFGLKTGGRTESILMSLPREARWLYNYVPPAGSREAELLDFLRPRDWLAEAGRSID